MAHYTLYYEKAIADGSFLFAITRQIIQRFGGFADTEINFEY